LLVAMGIAVSIMGSAFALATGWQFGFGAEAERADVQQRLRVAVEVLSGDLARAGGGARDGSSGALGVSVAAVLPYRPDSASPDPPGTVRPDAITILSAVPNPAAQTTLRSSLAARSGDAFIRVDPGCPADDQNCGFDAGMDLVVFDDTGAFDTFRVASVEAGTLNLRHTMPDSSRVYPAGARIVAAASRTYWLRTDESSGASQLVRSDGTGPDAPVVDHLVALTFDYFGEPLPPALVHAVSDPAGPWTTYGPRPPALEQRVSAYPAGENCAFAVDAAPEHVPRLDPLGAGSAALVMLDAARLSDGPWCPDAFSLNRYDADLLRVRRIAVTLRVETPLSALRGPASVLFARGGTSRTAIGWVPDQEVRFDVAPRNLNLGR